MKKLHEMTTHERAEHEHRMAMVMHGLLREAARKNMRAVEPEPEVKAGTTLEMLDQIVRMFTGSSSGKPAHRRLSDGV